MSTTQKKSEWMAEHLKYEIWMLRQSFKAAVEAAAKISANPDTGDRFLYNAYFETFVVHARNMRDFFRNDDGSTNFHSDDFVPDFRAIDYSQDIQNKMNDLNRQVFHLSKDRPTSGSRKFDILKCQAVLEWVEVQIDAFHSQLPEPFVQVWNSMVPHIRITRPSNVFVAEYQATGSVSVNSSNPTPSANPTIVGSSNPKA